MRSITMGLTLILVLVMAPVTAAQQVPMPQARLESQTLTTATAGPRVNLTPVRIEAIRKQEATETAAARQVSARSVLAIIGAVVVVIALVSLLS